MPSKHERVMVTLDKDLILPEFLKEELRKPLGTVIECSEIPKRVKPSDRIVAVGDSVSASLISAGVLPSLIIWDGKSHRKPVDEKTLRILREYAPAKRVKNPASMITKEAWSAVESAIGGKRASIFVEGEEDLLAIPTVLNSTSGTKVIYGFPPGKGAILIDVNSKTKALFRGILLGFEKSGK